MVEPAIQVAQSVLDRQDRYLRSPSNISTMAILQAWDHLVGAPEEIARELSVEQMAHTVVNAATAVLSVYEICEGKLPLAAVDIGQRALGTFEVTIHDKIFTLKWGHESDGWRWMATIKSSPQVYAMEPTLKALCDALNNMPEPT